MRCRFLPEPTMVLDTVFFDEALDLGVDGIGEVGGERCVLPAMERSLPPAGDN